MGDVVKGIDECYVCGKRIEWEADVPVQKGVMSWNNKQESICIVKKNVRI